MKRQLSEEEKTICVRQMQAITDQNEYLGYAVAYHELQVNKGLYLDFKAKQKKSIDEMNSAKQTLEANDKIIAILKVQMEEGVEVKEQPIEDNNGELVIDPSEEIDYSEEGEK